MVGISASTILLRLLIHVTEMKLFWLYRTVTRLRNCWPQLRCVLESNPFYHLFDLVLSVESALGQIRLIPAVV